MEPYENYSQSFQHKDTIILAKWTCSKLLTMSKDGYLKFWKPCPKSSVDLLEFIIGYRAVRGEAGGFCLSGGYFACWLDGAFKVFDCSVVDMIYSGRIGGSDKKDLGSIKVGCWVELEESHQISLILVTEKGTVFRCDQSKGFTPQIIKEDCQFKFIAFNKEHQRFIALTQKAASIEIYTQNFEIIPTKSKYKNDLSELELLDYCDTPNYVCFLANDFKLRIYKKKDGKLFRKYSFDESSEKGISFDENTMNFYFSTKESGIQVMDVESNLLGEPIAGTKDSFIPQAFDIWYPFSESVSLDLLASSNPILKNVSERWIACCAKDQSRFYLYTNFIPKIRDQINEDPELETSEAMTSDSKKVKRDKRLTQSVILQTSMGDLHLKLFNKEAPLAVENFITHCENGYYDNTIILRVDPTFMIQAGDPTGTGTGGTSIWNDKFADEICDELNFDNPHMLAMANIGPNTNGSQFFITLVPCPWLSGKHTVFGKLVRGVDVLEAIAGVERKGGDRPKKDISIYSVDLIK